MPIFIHIMVLVFTATLMCQQHFNVGDDGSFSTTLYLLLLSLTKSRGSYLVYVKSESASNERLKLSTLVVE